MKKLLTVSVWMLAFLAAGLGVFNMVDLLVTDLPGDYVEGVVLAAQHQISDGKPLYHESNWTGKPYSINLYGPVGYHLGAFVAGFFTDKGSLIPGRLLALAALSAALAALWILQRRVLELPRTEAVLGLLIPLGYLPVVVFATQYRVDVLAVAFSLVGLVLAAPERRGLWLSPLFFVLAVFTKPTTIAAVVALGLWWLSRRKWRPFLIVAIGCLVLGGASLAVVTMTTDGAFTKSVFGFNALPFALGGLIHAAHAGLGGGLLPLAGAIAVTMVGAGESRHRLVALYLLTSSVLTFATIGRVGANFNYFIEPGLIMGPLIAIAWARQVNGFERFTHHLSTAAILAAVLASSLLWVGPRVINEVRDRSDRKDVERRFARWIQPGDTVLSTEIVSVYRLQAEPYLNDPSIFTRLAEAGLWNQNPMLEDLESGAVHWVLADEDMAAPNPVYSNWTAETRAVVVRSFDEVDHISRYYLYRRSSHQ